MAAGNVNGRQHLIIDADDTLWENNIYFERAFEEFCEFLDHSTMPAADVRAVLDEIEIANSKVHGYGSLNFGRNLRECYQRLAMRAITAEDLSIAMGFAERILEQPLELIEGVPETLAYLQTRHELTLFTKGQAAEQTLKLDRSGLGVYFHHVAIVKEKNAASYGALIKERGFVRQVSWMIGNSPKSDINPALEVGMNAVFIPHAHTWRLEHEEVRTPGGGKLIEVERFSLLRSYF